MSELVDVFNRIAGLNGSVKSMTNFPKMSINQITAFSIAIINTYDQAIGMVDTYPTLTSHFVLSLLWPSFEVIKQQHDDYKLEISERMKMLINEAIVVMEKEDEFN